MLPIMSVPQWTYLHQTLLRRVRTPGISQPGVALHVDADFVRALRPLDGVDLEGDGVACQRMMENPLLHPLTRCLLAQHHQLSNAALSGCKGEISFLTTHLKTHSFYSLAFLPCARLFVGVGVKRVRRVRRGGAALSGLL